MSRLGFAKWTSYGLSCAAALGLFWSCAGGTEPEDGEVAATAAHLAWQEERLEELRAEDGWLAVVGLAWLQEGDQTLGWGSPEDADGVAGAEIPDITLPEPPAEAPALLATIRVAPSEAGVPSPQSGAPDGLATFLGAPVHAWIAPFDCPHCRITLPTKPRGAEVPVGALSEVQVGGAKGWFPFSRPPEGPPIIFRARGFEMFTMERGGRLALRVRNRNSPRREMLVSIPTHDYARGWTIEGRFEPAESVRELAIDNSTDHDYPQRSVGRFVFQRDGQRFEMELIGSNPEEPQLLMVGDASNGDTTYGGGRYLYVDVEDDGVIRADFNRLYNPPCVFTPWATCPLPPPSNRLPFRVPVGERNPVFVAGAK